MAGMSEDTTGRPPKSSPKAVFEEVAPGRGVSPVDSFARYFCKNCGITSKIYAFSSYFVHADLYCFKYGESPEFGLPDLSRLNALIKPERELFRKGQRCEMLGLGIGAYTYYRRVVESQKDRLLDQMIAACKKL